MPRNNNYSVHDRLDEHPTTGFNMHLLSPKQTTLTSSLILIKGKEMARLVIKPTVTVALSGNEEPSRKELIRMENLPFH